MGLEEATKTLGSPEVGGGTKKPEVTNLATCR